MRHISQDGESSPRQISPDNVFLRVRAERSLDDLTFFLLFGSTHRDHHSHIREGAFSWSPFFRQFRRDTPLSEIFAPIVVVGLLNERVNGNMGAQNVKILDQIRWAVF